MKNFLTNKIKVLSILMALLLVSCYGNAEQAQPIAEASLESQTIIITGSVTDSTDIDITLATAGGDVTFDTSDALLYGDISEGAQVEALVNGNTAEFVAVANENNPVVNLSGYIVSADGESVTVLSGGELHSFNTVEADILFGDIPAVGDAVRLISTESGKAIELEITEFGGGRIQGEVSMLTDTLMMITTPEGINLPFLTKGIILPEDLEVGQLVTLDYHGSLAGSYNAVAIYNDEIEQLQSGEISGVVSDLVNGLISVRTEDGGVYSFTYATDNTFTGNRLIIGDSVTISYSLASDGQLVADTITPIAYGSRGSYKLEGVLTGYEPGLLTIRTENGNSYSFSHNEATAVYSEQTPTVGDVVEVVFERNDNNFLRCSALYGADFEPQTQSVTGDVVNIETDTISIVDEQNTEIAFYYAGATLNSPLPIMRGDNITIEYIEVPSGNADATAITFNSASTPFEPQHVDLQDSGVAEGVILLNDDMLFVQEESGRLYVFSTDDAEFAPGIEVGSNVYVQYIGDPLYNAEAVLVSPTE